MFALFYTFTGHGRFAHVTLVDERQAGRRDRVGSWTLSQTAWFDLKQALDGAANLRIVENDHYAVLEGAR